MPAHAPLPLPVRLRAAVALAALLSSAAPADASAATPPAPRYPFAATVRVPPESRAEFVLEGSTTALPFGTVTVKVGEQARTAWQAAARRMFEGSGDGAALEITVAVAAADASGTVYSARVALEHQVVAWTPQGGVIGSWRVRGDSEIVGLDAAAVVRAFARAAARAASAWEAQFDGSPEVRAWLDAQGYARRAPPPAPPPAPRPDRAGLVAWTAIGPAIELDPAPPSRGDGARLGLGARIGVSGTRYLGALAIDLADAAFVARTEFGQPDGDARFLRTAFGLDAARVHRFGPEMEGHAGVGARVVGGTATLDYTARGAAGARRELSITKWTLAGSAFIGLHTTTRPWRSVGLRGRVGGEFRVSVGGHLAYDAFGTSVGVAPITATVFLGVEFPDLSR